MQAETIAQRMEGSPGEASKEDVFLHLIQTGDNSTETMIEAVAIEEDGTVGVRFIVDGKTVSVTFGTEGSPSGHVNVKRGNSTEMDKDLTTTVMPQSGLSGGK